MQRRPLAALITALALAACSGGSEIPATRDAAATDIATDIAADISPDVTPDAGGCRADDDCASDPSGARACDTATGRCVACVPERDTCPADQHCVAATHACSPGCRSDEGCSTATTGDAGAPDGGVVSNGRCDTAAHACVDCVTDDHCPPGLLCVGHACVVGCTATSRCPDGQTCCPGASGAMGACVDLSANAASCGACGAACSTPNGVPACERGACATGRCTAPFADCDGDVANGCETDTLTAVAHCGACGVACPARANATATCSGSSCGFTCDAGFADCDGDPENGCEVDTRTSLLHCGACRAACEVANGTGACAAGACTVSACNEGFGDCNGAVADGCETDTRVTPAHCGACGTACAIPANASPVCAASTCGLGACDAGFADCDMNPANGCEVDTRTTLANCGACGAACAPSNATGACVAGACRVAACADGFADCDMDPANGCEVDIRVAVGDCGRCGNACPTPPSGTPACVARACGVGMCAAGRGNCDGSDANGCETETVTNVSNCGGCGNRCTAPPNGAAACVASACTLGACSAGFANCDGSASNGCEVDTDNDAANCGGCGTACSFANATPRCAAGRCALGACGSGFDNCDGASANGCETSLNTDPDNCGACGAQCSFANAAARCVGGACALGACAAGYGNCDGSTANGCESDLNSDPLDCGACGRACAAGSTCEAGLCQFAGGTTTLTVGSGTQTVNTVRASVNSTSGSPTITVSNVQGTFAPGQRVLLHQTISTTSAIVAGTYEYRQVTLVNGTTLTLDRAPSAVYRTNSTDRAQVVVVERYAAVNVAAGATLTAPAWDGNVGGVLAVDVAGAFVNAGTVTMSGRGLRGRGHACTYQCARGYQGEGSSGFGGADITRNGNAGGGGGAGQDDGAGGGGGHGTAGGNGGAGTCGICREACPVPGGLGGAVAGTPSLASLALMGGAGGEGGADEDGGNPGIGGAGGGIILLRVTTLSNTGAISTDGAGGAGGNQSACGGGGCGMGGGGGGAGGGVRVVAITSATLGTLVARGGGGGGSTCGTSVGGAGGVGRVSVFTPSVSGASTPTFFRE
ncbi:MAG: hypothetical protein R3A52_05850 [Polyangiales bacterium]